MAFAYLGFLDILQKLMKALFENIFRPIMEDILVVLFKLLGSLINELLSSLIMQVMVMILQIVDFFSNIFDIFSGAQNITYDGKESKMIDVFIGYGPVRTAFLALSLFAAGLAFLFTIYAVAKSISDMSLDGKNPVGKILGRGLKAALGFLLVPLMCYLLIQLSSSIVVTVSDAIATKSGSSQPSVGTIIFLSGSLEAANDGRYNQEPSFDDALRGYYFCRKDAYTDYNRIKSDFDFKKFNKFVPIISAILVIIIMALCIFQFVQRIFEVLILYLVAPFYIAAMPLDDGALFGKWRDMFVAKLMSGFGSVFTMKLFLVVVPMICGPYIKLNADATVNGILTVFFVIGGAWATYRSQTLLLQILNPEAAMASQGSILAMMGGLRMVSAIAGQTANPLSGKGKSKSSGSGGANAMPRSPSEMAQQYSRSSGK